MAPHGREVVTHRPCYEIAQHHLHIQSTAIQCKLILILVASTALLRLHCDSGWKLFIKGIYLSLTMVTRWWRLSGALTSITCQ